MGRRLQTLDVVDARLVLRDAPVGESEATVSSGARDP